MDQGAQWLVATPVGTSTETVSATSQLKTPIDAICSVADCRMSIIMTGAVKTRTWRQQFSHVIWPVLISDMQCSASDFSYADLSGAN
jgi:hypothetical protein